MVRLFMMAAFGAALGTPAARADPLHDAVLRDMPTLMPVYRALHAHPELAFQEVKSSALIAEEWRRLGFAVTTGLGRTGVVAVMANGPGPVVLLRTDMDALPVAEQTGLPFASTVRAVTAQGRETAVMHACGHDTHMTAMIGTARRLADLRGSWSGTLVLVAQPAEEAGAGARAMLDDGLFTRFPRPQYLMAFHDSATLPAGAIGVRAGYVMANVDGVDITVRGRGGHGAYPQMTRDPVVLGARIVTTLQTLVSRERNPVEPAVVTVGSFQAGATYNVIPDEAHLMLTVRSYSPASRQGLLDGIARIARGEAIAAGIPDDRLPIVAVRDGHTPSVFNTRPLADRMAGVFAARFGAGRMMPIEPSMGGEDFSRYRLADPEAQSLLFWVGGVPQAQWDAVAGDTTRLPALHSAQWAPDAQGVIATAIEAMTAGALDLLSARHQP
jgi:amidohydrolase